METHLSTLVGSIVLNRAAPEKPGVSATTDAFRSGPALSIPGLRDLVTKELLLKIEAQLPNVAASRFRLRALRDHMTIQISEAKELRSRFPDSFLHGRACAVLTEPYAATETAANP